MKLIPPFPDFTQRARDDRMQIIVTGDEVTDVETIIPVQERGKKGRLLEESFFAPAMDNGRVALLHNNLRVPYIFRNTSRLDGSIFGFADCSDIEEAGTYFVKTTLDIPFNSERWGAEDVKFYQDGKLIQKHMISFYNHTTMTLFLKMDLEPGVRTDLEVTYGVDPEQMNYIQNDFYLYFFPRCLGYYLAVSFYPINSNYMSPANYLNIPVSIGAPFTGFSILWKDMGYRGFNSLLSHDLNFSITHYPDQNGYSMYQGYVQERTFDMQSIPTPAGQHWLSLFRCVAEDTLKLAVNGVEVAHTDFNFAGTFSQADLKIGMAARVGNGEPEWQYRQFSWENFIYYAQEPSLPRLRTEQKCLEGETITWM